MGHGLKLSVQDQPRTGEFFIYLHLICLGNGGEQKNNPTGLPAAIPANFRFGASQKAANVLMMPSPD